MVFTMEREKPDVDVVFAGSVIQRKGIEDFIEAVRIVAKILPGIRAKVIGGNRNKLYMDFLIARIRSYGLADNIAFLGFLPEHRDVLREMSKAKVMMLPSHVDTGPRAVAECMALGIPVIAYNVDGLPWMIEDGFRGMLVEKGNTEALGERLLILLKDSERRRVLAESAKDFAREHFYAPTIFKRLLEIYEDILQRQC
jgi:glycosyltransferase involved in cell wall biosynthesis